MYFNPSTHPSQLQYRSEGEHVLLTDSFYLLDYKGEAYLHTSDVRPLPDHPNSVLNVLASSPSCRLVVCV